jgi:hypothetical protein
LLEIIGDPVMRLVLTLLIGVALAAPFRLRAEPVQSEKRFDQALDLKKYPQDTPKNAATSFIKAIEHKDIEYLLAQLAEPTFVDQRVKDNGGKFEVLVQEAKAKLADDPAALKLLQRLAKEGDWKIEGDRAILSLEGAPDRQVLLVKRKDRWFVENRFKPEKPKEKASNAR